MIFDTNNLVTRFVGKETKNLYFTADTHFGHSNILGFCDRPFKTIEEHDEVLVANWKKKIPENAIVYHLGDVGFGSSERVKKILEELPGKIYLIVGNHDLPRIEAIKGRFEAVYWQHLLQIGRRFVALNHYPFLCYAGVYKKHLGHTTVQLFGHVHSLPGNKGTGLDIPRLDKLFPWQYDVGVDNNGFAPVSWTEIQAIMEKRRQEAVMNSENEQDENEP